MIGQDTSYVTYCILDGSLIMNHYLILQKGWNQETMAEVRNRYKEDFPKLFPNMNYAKLRW